MGRSDIAFKIFKNFEARGWPRSILVSGRQGIEKDHLVQDAIQNELWEKRIQEHQSLSHFEYLLAQNEHPDCYEFPDANIAIGEDGSSSEKGTIRHLLNHFIPYAPRESHKRFVYFKNASKIGDQAESALLKVLEEPPSHTHFILCSHSPYDLKETIRSRCLEVPFIEPHRPEKVPTDPWERFWSFSGQTGSHEYRAIQRTEWSEHIKDSYDRLSYGSKDFLIFDSLGPADIKKQFPKEQLETLNKILILNLLPLYFSLRDAMVEGKTPSIGPIQIPPMELSLNYGALFHLRKLFLSLRKKYFQTRAIHSLPVYYLFINRFMKYWSFKN